MKHYLDITLLPDAETNLGFLWQKVYQQIHIALVENKTANGNSVIAVSFPKYTKLPKKGFPLGDKLRLLAPTQDQLQQLNVTKWLNRLSDYTHCTSIKEVPTTVNDFVCFKRKQFKSNLLKKAERRASHLNKPLTEVLKFFETEGKEPECKLPFINMISLSTVNDSVGVRDKLKFKLFIEKEDVEKSKEGELNCYGLSGRSPDSTVTVPSF